MCVFCGPMYLNPDVAEIWDKDFERLSPKLRTYIQRAADILKAEIEADALEDEKDANEKDANETTR